MVRCVKAAFHDTDTDILARILADTSDTRDFLARKSRASDVSARILARMSVSVLWNAAFMAVSCGTARRRATPQRNAT